MSERTKKVVQLVVIDAGGEVAAVHRCAVARGESGKTMRGCSGVAVMGGYGRERRVVATFFRRGALVEHVQVCADNISAAQMCGLRREAVISGGVATTRC